MTSRSFTKWAVNMPLCIMAGEAFKFCNSWALWNRFWKASMRSEFMRKEAEGFSSQINDLTVFIFDFVMNGSSLSLEFSQAIIAIVLLQRLWILYNASVFSNQTFFYWIWQMLSISWNWSLLLGSLLLVCTVYLAKVSHHYQCHNLTIGVLHHWIH